MNWINRISNYVKATKYNIGFIDGDLESVIEGNCNCIRVNWLKHNYHDRWFADPFILDVTESELVVLVEEWYDPIQRGRISKLVIDRRTFRLKDLKVMIDDGTHLSFPAIERDGEDIYIHPESSVKGRLENYRYNKDKDCFEKCGVLCKLPLTDSVMTRNFGQKLLFSTKLPDANGKELGIYVWDEEKKEYVEESSYYFEENISRNAGNFFTYRCKIIRPAQVCIKSYGDSISLQEVFNINNQWSFKEIKRLYSPHPDLDLGFHTFNVYKGVIVVDAIGYRRAMLCHILRNLKHLIN